jgi:hypothetical protein
MALRATHRGGVPSPISNLVAPSVAHPRAAAAPAVFGVAPARRDAGPPVHNPSRDPRFVGNTPLAHSMRSRSAAVAITNAGRDPPEVVRSGTRVNICVSWHGRGKCFELCERAADHGVLSKAEVTDFHSWYEVAYA